MTSSLPDTKLKQWRGNKPIPSTLPAGFLDQHPAADLFISSDCLSHRAEAEGIPDVPRCGHVPGSTGHKIYNTGLLALRNRPATRRIMRAWHHRLAHPSECVLPPKTFYLQNIAVTRTAVVGQRWCHTLMHVVRK